VRDDAPSMTAAWVAAMRGLGAFLPDRLRLVDDPYGLNFAGALSATRERRSLERGLRLVRHAWMRGRLRGFVVYMQLRTRVIDDEVTAFVRAGGRQLVLLGAGFDARAWRMPELAGVNVFEVDHPATQAKKRATMRNHRPIGNVAYIAWDFEREPLDRLRPRLALDGHDAASPTMTILEGVLPYLTEEACHATFLGVGRYSRGGCPIAFTYMDEKSVLAKRHSAARRMLRLFGEPFRLGFQPNDIGDWLLERGFALERDESIAEVADRLLGKRVGARIRRRGRGQRFALARTLVMAGPAA
jgi:methyltransferase (TIGR00027 family)